MDPINPIAGNPEAINDFSQKKSPLAFVKSEHLTVVSFAAFIILALGIVAFLYNQNQQLKKMLAGYQTPPPSPTPAATADPMSDWKSYTSTKHNYSFKYPTDWNIRGVAGSQSEIESSDTFFLEGPYQDIITLEGNPEYTIKVEVSKNKSESVSVEQIVKSKQAADIYVVFNMTLYNPTGNISTETFDQILSTFQFTGPSEAAAKEDKFTEPTETPLEEDKSLE